MSSDAHNLSYSHTCDADCPKFSPPRGKSSFIEPVPPLFNDEFLFESSFEGFESLPTPLEPLNDSIPITSMPLSPPTPRNKHIVAGCEVISPFTPALPISSRDNTSDDLTPSHRNSDPGYDHTNSPCCPHYAIDTFAPPSPSRRPLSCSCIHESTYQDILPTPLHQEYYQYDHTSQHSTNSHFAIPSVKPPIFNSEYSHIIDVQECPYSSCHHINCPNSPAGHYKQPYYCNSARTGLTAPKHTPVPKKNSKLLSQYQCSPTDRHNPPISSNHTPQCSIHVEEPGCENKHGHKKDVATPSVINSVETDVPVGVLSQDGSAYNDEDSLYSTQYSNTQNSTFSEEAIEGSSQPEELSSSGKYRYNFSVGSDNLSAQKIKDHKKKKQNNERERIRIRSMNKVFKELGDVCSFYTNERAQTKLDTLQQALTVLQYHIDLKNQTHSPKPVGEIESSKSKYN